MLYATDSSYRPWFQEYQLAQGFFYGMREMGRLVAVAGTHLVSFNEGIAAVGNVFTHPDCRGRGYASACTTRVTEALLNHNLMIVLNVSQGNPAAERVYRRLGYLDHCEFLEAPAARRTVR
jgi:predicted GNAT family acetyltransferase